ncbi:suppressor of SWI4 1 homolog isoform X2 [Silurus meridionalis]|uniref:suppressor of SWI4 1 homolog isoform X2 n=1 Tax=Silurus meridionalis TaxID=175797 RepID=UPI001EECB1F7|nr:suppressor of SWI4 1 homolog isoform X2 [Silurus meridionalis]
MRAQQSAVCLTEIGPRMTLQLVKIVEGMGEGNVLYHSIMTKSEEEIREILKRKEARLQEKAERRRMQEQNIAFKDEKREENNTLKGMKRKWQKEEAASDDSEVEDTGMQEDQPEAEESEDEAEYYRQAVWEEPDEDMFPSLKRKHGPDTSFFAREIHLL